MTIHCQRFIVSNLPWNSETYIIYDSKKEVFFSEMLSKRLADKTCEWLNHQEMCKIKTLEFIQDKLSETEEAYNNAVKAGAPTGGIYGELDLLSVINKELNEIWLED